MTGPSIILAPGVVVVTFTAMEAYGIYSVVTGPFKINKGANQIALALATGPPIDRSVQGNAKRFVEGVEPWPISKSNRLDEILGSLL
jgi:hypothetical protein